MNLRAAMIECPGMPPEAAARAFERVAFAWGGAQLHMKKVVCRSQSHPRRPSRGAAAHLAAAIETAMLAEGGSSEDVRIVLTALLGARVWVDA